MASQVIPFSRIKKIDIINVKGGITAADIMKKYNPDYLVNLALYDTTSGENITRLIDENKPSGYLFSDDGIGLVKGLPVWTSFEEAKKDKEITDYVSGSPVLVSKGKKDIDWGNRYSSYVDGTHLRTAVGFNDKSLILLATDSSVSLNKLAETCIDLGATHMINCDGGGSCHLQKGNSVYRRSYRRNCSWLLVYTLEDDEVKVKVDGKEYVFTAIVKDGRTYVQLREFEQAGYSIGYTNGVASIDKPSK